MSPSDLLRLCECVKKASKQIKVIGFETDDWPSFRDEIGTIHAVDADILLAELEKWANELKEE